MSRNGVMDNSPWLVPAAVDAMAQFLTDIPIPRVLEWGAGGSTLWLAERCNWMVSIEHDPEWHGRVVRELVARKLESAMVMWASEDRCAGAGNVLIGPFDLILVDGINRNNCVLVGSHQLKHGGMLVLDNTERADEYAESLTRWLKGWERKDYVGDWQTSIFVKP